MRTDRTTAGSRRAWHTVDRWSVSNVACPDAAGKMRDSPQAQSAAGWPSRLLEISVEYRLVLGTLGVAPVTWHLGTTCCCTNCFWACRSACYRQAGGCSPQDGLAKCATRRRLPDGELAAATGALLQPATDRRSLYPLVNQHHKFRHDSADAYFLTPADVSCLPARGHHQASRLEGTLPLFSGIERQQHDNGLLHAAAIPLDAWGRCRPARAACCWHASLQADAHAGI